MTVHENESLRRVEKIAKLEEVQALSHRKQLMLALFCIKGAKEQWATTEEVQKVVDLADKFAAGDLSKDVFLEKAIHIHHSSCMAGYLIQIIGSRSSDNVSYNTYHLLADSINYANKYRLNKIRKYCKELMNLDNIVAEILLK